VDDLLNACRIHGDVEMGKHIMKTSSGIGFLEMAWGMSYCHTSLPLASEIEEAIEVRRRC